MAATWILTGYAAVSCATLTTDFCLFQSDGLGGQPWPPLAVGPHFQRWQAVLTSGRSSTATMSPSIALFMATLSGTRISCPTLSEATHPSAELNLLTRSAPCNLKRSTVCLFALKDYLPLALQHTTSPEHVLANFVRDHAECKKSCGLECTQHRQGSVGKHGQLADSKLFVEAEHHSLLRFEEAFRSMQL